MKESYSILIGSAIIALAILISGGVIKLGNLNVKPASAPAASSTPAQQATAKTEADMVKKMKEYAGKLGLDQGKFDKCLDSGEKASLVANDSNDGTSLGVNGTPAFFVNGRIVEGAVPYAQFKQILDEEASGSGKAATVERKTVGKGDLPPKGDGKAKITIVEFSDYQCPFCSRFFIQTEGQIRKEYVDSGKAVFYYRDFPLSQIHPGAQKAAEAARCAGDQEKYWEYHDSLFQNQNDIF